VAISEATSRLVQGYFGCEALGAQTLRGVAEPVAVYRVLGDSGVHSRLEVAQTRGLTPLVGREQEVGLLLERWEQVKAGQGHVVLLSGEGGIGKSRLVQMLKEHVAHEPPVRWECRSSSYYENTALFPLVDLFQRLLRFEAHETPNAKGSYWIPGSYTPCTGLKHLILNGFFQGCRIGRAPRGKPVKTTCYAKLNQLRPWNPT
jgi:hypothetical protein